MTDHTMPMREMPRRRGPSLEYRSYYTVIFIAALPVACLKWLGELPVEKTDRHRSPIGEARALTETVLPYIFMA